MTDTDDACGYPGANGPCSNPPTGDDGYCWLATHSDDADAPDREPDGRGAPEGNDNAVTVAAWADDFVSGYLEDDEIKRVEDLSELLDDPTSAQEVAARAASLSLEQFRRTNDQHFLRRFESICEKANLFPDDDETSVNVSLDDLYRDE